MGTDKQVSETFKQAAESGLNGSYGKETCEVLIGNIAIYKALKMRKDVWLVRYNPTFFEM